MTHPVLVIGAGGHAKVLLDTLLIQNVNVVGIVDADAEKIGAQILGISVLGDDSYIKSYSPSEIVLVNGLGYVGTLDLRKQVYMRFKEQGYAFQTVIHPSAVISASAVLEEGVQVMAGAVIQPECKIGRNSIVNTRAALDHDCRIGWHVHIAPGVTLSGSVSVGDGAHIGVGATIIQGRNIGSGALVGAGAVVVNNIADHRKVVGIPAR